jgi:hemoglobin-like flavoprotein
MPATHDADGAASPRGRDALEAIAESIADEGDRFVDALYDAFFARCPEARALFGAHSLSEQGEMVNETFRAIVAWLDDEPWLDANLIAFGESHVEYGVEDAMYPLFVDAFVETVAARSGEAEGSPGLRLLRTGLEQITRAMATRSPAQRRC